MRFVLVWGRSLRVRPGDLKGFKNLKYVNKLLISCVGLRRRVLRSHTWRLMTAGWMDPRGLLNRFTFVLNFRFLVSSLRKNVPVNKLHCATGKPRHVALGRHCAFRHCVLVRHCVLISGFRWKFSWRFVKDSLFSLCWNFFTLIRQLGTLLQFTGKPDLNAFVIVATDAGRRESRWRKRKLSCQQPKNSTCPDGYPIRTHHENSFFTTFTTKMPRYNFKISLHSILKFFTTTHKSCRFDFH